MQIAKAYNLTEKSKFSSYQFHDSNSKYCLQFYERYNLSVNIALHLVRMSRINFTHCQ